jgi:hypothetical protein
MVLPIIIVTFCLMSSMPSISALRLLMSRDAIDRFGPAVSARLVSVPHQLVARESLAESGDAQIDVAFLTKDVSGRSTKTDLSAPLAHFFALLRQSTRLKWVHTHSAGADRPIYAEVIGRGVTVTTSSGLTADTVAQSAVGGVLALARRFPLLQEAQRRRSWEPLIDGRAPRDLKGQVAVVVGLGPIGREIARLLTAIGLHVIGVRTSATADPGCRDRCLPTCRRSRRADWLLLASLTGLTRQLVDGLLSRLPRGVSHQRGARRVVVEQERWRHCSRAGLPAHRCLRN